MALRGSGRSYGDANVGSEGIVLDLTRMNRIIAWDPVTGVIDAQAGVTIEDLWRYCLEDGWWPPVVTGTMYPTLGGALGMNVHGKNNFCAGTLGEHVLEFEVWTPGEGIRVLDPADLEFYAFISSAGLLGVITRIRLQMKKVVNGSVKVWAESPPNWDGQFALFEKYESCSDYMVSWIDCFATGSKAGRGQFHAAWYEHFEDRQSLRADKQDLPSLIMGFFPKATMWRFLKLFCNRFGMRMINAAKQFAGEKLGNGKMHPQSLVAFSFLLDYVPDWRRAYEPDGFIQYQSFVPKEHAKRVFAAQVELQQSSGLESYLGVLKRHRPDNFLFSHAVDGYSMAMDFKVTQSSWPRLLEMAHRMNDLVLEAGGRFYFAKDSTLRPSDLEAYMGAEKLATYRSLKAKYDPESLLQTDLSRRLGL